MVGSIANLIYIYSTLIGHYYLAPKKVLNPLEQMLNLPQLMDNILLQTLTTQHWLEAEENQETYDRLQLITVVLVIGSNEDHTWAVENQQPHQQYLRQAALLPNPWFGTPWTCLYTSYDNRTFIMTMGVNTSTFYTILTAGFGQLWYTLPIFCPNTQATENPHVWKRSLDAEGGLGLILHWLSSTMRQLSLQQIFTLIPSTISRYL